MSIAQQINKRRTFAIISHPDAGKTTLTEKFLLFGGAIQTAGAVKSNKIKKSATSDFMDIERQRGISVATSVMSFEYMDTLINILDTPGHKDFAEDTYRTLTAVDSVILVVDCVKGVEEQTKKLMEVCRMRNTPVIIFINKLDMEGQDPFDLLDELEDSLSIKVRPMSWPINIGKEFKGVYKLFDSTLNLFDSSITDIAKDVISIKDINDPLLDESVGNQDAEKLREDVELIEGVYEPFNIKAYQDGSLAPVFFGSALYTFGVQELLEKFIEIAPLPGIKETSGRDVIPTESKFSGFVFKIHANLDPNHRDRIAFLRVCSGTFERNKFFYHVRNEKKLRFSAPFSFMASKRNIVEEAYAGDVVGLYDAGNFKIGDTLTEGEKFSFKGMPSFSPELFRAVVNTDPMKTKQLHKGLAQLSEEGVAQLFSRKMGNQKVIGTVGDLQFEVIQYRLKHEYGASCNFEGMSAYKACWITSNNEEQLDNFTRIKSNNIYLDKEEHIVFLAESSWALQSAQEQYPDITFHFNSDFQLDN